MEELPKVETTRRPFFETLAQEMVFFKKLAELHNARDVEITEPLKDSRMISSQVDLDKIMRYEVRSSASLRRWLTNWLP